MRHSESAGSQADVVGKSITGWQRHVLIRWIKRILQEMSSGLAFL
jgi:hypothetical protein